MRSLIIALLMAILAVSVRADGSGGGPGPSTVPAGREKRNPRSQNGAYTVMISGYYKGQGSATVTAASVLITGQVHTDGGPMVTFKSDTLQITGPYFSGNGTVGDTKLTIKGRLDAASSSRLMATFKTNDNHRGRIAGTLPTDPPNPNWNDDHHGDDGGGGNSSGGDDGGGKGK